MDDAKNIIARRIAQELHDGDVVNLGIGLPTLVANYLPQGVDITIQSENGVLGVNGSPEQGKEDPDLTNAGGKYITVRKGASFFDTATSFGIIRGGHVDATVLGALEVDEKGNLASHMVPGKMVSGMGGAMDLATGTKKIIIGTLHTNNGKPKILKSLTLPITAVGVVKVIVTEIAVIEVSPLGLVLKEIAEGTTVEQVKAATEAELLISPDLRTFSVQ
jgi:acetate CoA/acetoacetate CoA-transferase beta subunit